MSTAPQPTLAEPLTPQAAARRYYAPARSVDAEVSLSEFSRSEILEYLDHLNKNPARSIRGYENGMEIDGHQLSRIETLALCGQKQEARDYLCRIVGDQIGRAL